MTSQNSRKYAIQTALMIGAGRLAWSLIPALQQVGINVEGIVSRTYSEAERYGDVYSINSENVLKDLPPSDLIILTVPDSAVESTAHLLRPYLSQRQVLVHTSGSISLKALGEFPDTGVLYPMQAFTKESVVPFNNPDIPLFVEGSNDRVKNGLLDLARRLSGKAQFLDSEARRKLHMGAVIACNFSNLMYRLTDELIPEVEFTVFESLIRHQVDLATKLGPAAAQTGPAIRGDQETIALHLEMLREKPELQEMYLRLSQLINPAISDPKEA